LKKNKIGSGIQDIAIFN